MINNQKGYIISIATFFVLTIMLSVAVSMSFLAAVSQKKATNNVKSAQSYYAAESGVEDALLRLKKNPSLSFLSYDLTVNNASVSVSIPSTVGTSKIITTQADNGGMKKNIQTVAILDRDKISFYYGVQAGQGGLQMSNGSRVKGNVFSSGNIRGSGIIDNNVVISGNGHSLDDVYVGGDALVYSCLPPASVRNLTYVTGGSHACTVRGTTSARSEEISEEPLPIPQTQIDEWKSEAEAAQVITGSITINGQARTLGPVKITGSLYVSNSATLKMTGTVFVAGDISISNNANIKLDSSYGSMGGVLITNGTISISNNSTFSGSGQAGSYVLVLSTSTSDSAISVSNNAYGAVLYASAGTLNIANGVKLLEATGYKIVMSNNSTIEYSSGMANIYFTSGTGGGWKVTSWQEY